MNCVGCYGRPTISDRQLQERVTEWARRCFGDDQVNTPQVRALRLLEEAIEFAQSVGVDINKVGMLTSYIYERSPGDPKQELGGVGVTWLVAASSIGVLADDVLRAEVERVESKSVEHFAKRNLAKCDAGFGGSQ